MKRDKAKIEDVKTQAELDAILERSDWQVIRGDRGVVLALVPRGLSTSGWHRLFAYIMDGMFNKNLGRVAP